MKTLKSLESLVQELLALYIMENGEEQMLLLNELRKVVSLVDHQSKKDWYLIL